LTHAFVRGFRNGRQFRRDRFACLEILFHLAPLLLARKHRRADNDFSVMDGG
jgi:hypothetical protein